MNEKEINVLELFKGVWRYKILVVIMAVLIALVSYGYVKFLTVPMYSSDGMLYVSNLTTDTTVSKVSQSDIYSARELTSTYVEVLKSRSFLTDVSNTAGTGDDWQQIYNMLSISAVNQTELISITVTATDANKAYKITDAILKCAPNKLVDTFKNGDVSVVNEAVLKTTPLSNGMVTKVITGFLIGALIGIVIAVLIGYFDKRVRSSEDLVKRYDVSVLGELA